MSQVKFAIPKGSLEEATFKILERAWTKVTRKSRTYRVLLDEIFLSESATKLNAEEEEND